MAVRVQVPPSAPTFEEAPISGAFFIRVVRLVAGAIGFL